MYLIHMFVLFFFNDCIVFFVVFTLIFFFFFFQAEDGIRDIGVTGVQTCALPICSTNVIAYPVRANNGAVIGVLAFGLNLARLQGVFANISLPEGSIVFLADAKEIGRASCRERV